MREESQIVREGLPGEPGEEEYFEGDDGQGWNNGRVGSHEGRQMNEESDWERLIGKLLTEFSKGMVTDRSQKFYNKLN